MIILWVFLGVAFWGTVLGGGLYFLRRYVRAIERRGTGEQVVAELRERLSSMEEIVDSLRSDVNRLEESEEFTTRLLTSGGGPSATRPKG
ncbi:MAG TPA: hypothetical protein VGH98_19925 [Gemmatimonadaceae bacterium]|jgi:hypothetical protein